MEQAIDKDTVISVELEKDGYCKMIRYQGEYEDHIADGWHIPIKATDAEELPETVELSLDYEAGDRDSLVEAAMREYGLKLSKQFKLENLILQVASHEDALTKPEEPPAEGE